MNHIYEKPTVSGGLWTDNDILELIKYVKKYPGGTPERWEKIASVMNRTVVEVTHMAKKVITVTSSLFLNKWTIEVDSRILYVR